MTNEQYSNMMVAIATIEAKIEKLEALLEAPVIENKLAVTGDIKPEHLSNFWNEPPTFHPDVLIVENEK